MDQKEHKNRHRAEIIKSHRILGGSLRKKKGDNNAKSAENSKESSITHGGREMKSALISIQPKWCELIASGKKTVEVRKTVPKLEPPFKCYIYCTLSGSNEFLKDSLGGDIAAWNRGKWWAKKGNVIGEFVCDEIQDMRDIDQAPTCLSIEEWLKYTDGHKGPVYGWHISDLVIYDEPKPLTDFVVRECLWHNIRNNGCIDASGERCYDCRLKRPPQSWCYVEGV